MRFKKDVNIDWAGGFNSDGEMDFVLEGTPLICTEVLDDGNIKHPMTCIFKEMNNGIWSYYGFNDCFIEITIDTG